MSGEVSLLPLPPPSPPPQNPPPSPYVAAHPDLDRSAVIDQALRLWRASELERAMEAQFAAQMVSSPPSARPGISFGARRSSASSRLSPPELDRGRAAAR